ncbi:hypothetical protein C8J57DRAFT_1300075, partial [Mycena rebaudengoi]
CSLRLSLLLPFCLWPFALVSRSAVLVTSLSLSTAVCMDLSPQCYVLRFSPSGCGYLPWTGLDGQYTGVAHRPQTAPNRSTKPFACCRGIYVPSSNDGPNCYFTDRRCFPRGQCVLTELSLIFTSLSLFPIFRCHVTLWDRHHILP